MSSAGASAEKEARKIVKEKVEDGDDKSSSSHGDYEDDDNYDDYIREFSFEPEIILGKRTEPDSFTCCRNPTSIAVKQRLLCNHKLFLPNTLSLSLPKPPPPAAGPMTDNINSIIPLQLDGSSEKNVELLAEAVPQKIHRCSPNRLSDKINLVKGTDEGAESAPIVVKKKDIFSIEAEYSESDPEEEEEKKARKDNSRKRKSKWWWRGVGKRRRKGGPLADDQVHHDIEAFYYVGTELVGDVLFYCCCSFPRLLCFEWDILLCVALEMYFLILRSSRTEGVDSDYE